MRKLVYISLVVLSFTLFGCTSKITTSSSALSVESISISTEYSEIDISLNLHQDKLIMEYSDIKSYGIVYEISDDVIISQLVVDDYSKQVLSETLLINLSNIAETDYDKTFYYRTYIVFTDDDKEDIISYSDDILNFNIYDMALESDSAFANEIKFFVENEAILEINIEANIEEYTASTTSLAYEVVLYRNEEDIYVVVEPKTGYRLSNQVTLIVNDELVNNSFYTITEQVLTYVYNSPIIIDPELYVDVSVTFNPDKGLWTSSIFDEFKPEAVLSVNSLNDISGNTFTIVDHSTTSLRWFYKLFIKYNETFDAYQVVYTDHATANISDLIVPEYDLVLAVHDNCLDVASFNTILKYSKGLDEDLYIVFDKDVLIYALGTIEASFYRANDISKNYNVTMNESETLPIPFKAGFTFIGWSDGVTTFNTFPRYQISERILEIMYTAIWNIGDLNDVESYLDNFIPNSLNGSITLPNIYGATTITWVSSNPQILSTSGSYKRPYQATSVVLSAFIQLGQDTVVKIYDIDVEGYKLLSAPLTSSYIYRDYRLVTDSFFTTLDIINCAFITADSNGALSGKSVLNSVKTYIIPKAQTNGNWVLFSVSPDSDWSDIVSSSTTINLFADNIVAMINQYGFDGVDIDWETPTMQESESFTEMMRVIYTKVKANNPNHLVTAAIPGGMWQTPRYDLEHSHQYLDYINMMTYGMVTNNGYYQNALSRSTTFASLANSVGKTLTSCSIEESIAIYNTYGIPNSKIVVGVAFYGIKQTRTYNSSTQTWSAWINAGSVSFTNIAKDYLDNSDYNSYYDSIAGVPYIIKTDGTEFISYDNTTSIETKSKYIINNGLAGIMYWENGLDQTGILIQAIQDGLNLK